MIKKISKQILKECYYDNILKDINNNCNSKDGEGLFYNGLFISKNIILIKESYSDKYLYDSEYYHYNINKNELKIVSNELDDHYREMFENSDILDNDNCFFIFILRQNLNIC